MKVLSWFLKRLFYVSLFHYWLFLCFVLCFWIPGRHFTPVSSRELFICFYFKVYSMTICFVIIKSSLLVLFSFFYIWRIWHTFNRYHHQARQFQFDFFFVSTFLPPVNFIARELGSIEIEIDVASFIGAWREVLVGDRDRKPRVIEGNWYLAAWSLLGCWSWQAWNIHNAT
jgi:hypothetical protein